MRIPGRSTRSNSGKIARSRLKLLLVSDQSGISPGTIGMIRDDLASILSRYVQIDAGSVEVKLVRPDAESLQTAWITAAFPIRNAITAKNKVLLFTQCVNSSSKTVS